jgi:UDP-glucose 4-epimerase
MNVLVTGASGFIGRHVVRALAAAGYHVTALSRSDPGPLGQARWIAANVRDPGCIELVAGHDAVVHLAALSDAGASMQQPHAYATTNACGTLHLLEGARRTGARFLLASTQRLYASSAQPIAEDAPLCPTEPYAYAKLVAEQWVRMYNALYGLPATILRFFSVYGPGQHIRTGSSGVVSIFVHRALAGQPLLVSGHGARDFTYVTDAVQGIMLALERAEAAGETFNVATGCGTTFEELARAVLEVTGACVPIQWTDRLGPPTSWVADISRARRVLGYTPRVSLREGLAQYVRWCREHG